MKKILLIVTFIMLKSAIYGQDFKSSYIIKPIINLQNASQLASPCGSCATATCIRSSASGFSAAENMHNNWPALKGSFCQEYIPNLAGPDVLESYHDITVGTSGNLGAVVSSYAGAAAGCTVSRTYELYPNGSTCTAGNLISPFTNNANASSYGNPEWTGLTPGLYTLKIIYTIPSSCALQDHCVVYYSSNNVAASCNCSSPNCTIGNVTTYADRFPPTGAQNCVSGLSETGTYTTFQTVTTDANGFIGAYVQALTTDVLATVSISSTLYPLGSCGDAASVIAADGNNINGRSATNGSWNPEWSLLTPNTNFILETTFTIIGGNMQGYCMDYYGTNVISPSPCNAKTGQISQ